MTVSSSTLRRSAAVWLAGTLVLGSIAFFAPAATAAQPPDGVYASVARASGVSVMIDSKATGGAFYVTNATAPFAEATARTGPANEAIASYAYDVNAVTGLYALGSGTSQAQGGPAFPEIPNVARARYPGSATHARTETSQDQVVGVLRARGAYADSTTDETSGYAETVLASASVAGSFAQASSFRSSLLALRARYGTLIPGMSAMSAESDALFSTGAQHATGSAVASATGIVSRSAFDVHDVSVAGGLVTIAGVTGASHAAVNAAGKPVEAVSTFNIAGAEVGGIPVTIGTGGVAIAGVPDGALPGAVAEMNAALSEALVAAGISMEVLTPVTSKYAGTSAATLGLRIRIATPEPQGIPGNIIELSIGRTEVNASFTPYPPPPPPSEPGPAVPDVPSTTITTTTIIPGGPPPSVPPQLAYRVARRSLPPVVMLFGLWQLSGVGWIVVMRWRVTRVAGL